jgi:hypothetical protein
MTLPTQARDTHPDQYTTDRAQLKNQELEEKRHLNESFKEKLEIFVVRLYPFIHVRHVRFLNNATASNQGKETSS